MLRGQNPAGAMSINNWCFCYHCYCYHYWCLRCNSLTLFFYLYCFIRLFWQGWGHSGRNEEEKKEMQLSRQSRWTKLKFSNLGDHPASFLDICLSECVFLIVDRNFHIWAKRSRNSVKLWLRKGGPFVKRLASCLYSTVIIHCTLSFNSFHLCFIAVKQGVFGHGLP